jgi:hypothetical protein
MEIYVHSGHRKVYMSFLHLSESSVVAQFNATNTYSSSQSFSYSVSALFELGGNSIHQVISSTTSGFLINSGQYALNVNFPSSFCYLGSAAKMAYPISSYLTAGGNIFDRSQLEDCEHLGVCLDRVRSI